MKRILIGTLLLLGTHAFASEIIVASPCPKTSLELGTYTGNTSDQGTCSLTISCHMNTGVDGSQIPLYDFAIHSEKLSALSSMLQEGDTNIVSAIDDDVTSEHLHTWSLIDGLAFSEDSIVDSIQFSGQTPVSFSAVTRHRNFFGVTGAPQMNTDCNNLAKD